MLLRIAILVSPQRCLLRPIRDNALVKVLIRSSLSELRLREVTWGSTPGYGRSLGPLARPGAGLILSALKKIGSSAARPLPPFSFPRPCKVPPSSPLSLRRRRGVPYPVARAGGPGGPHSGILAKRSKR